MEKLLEKLQQSVSSNVQVAYNGKIVDMGYVTDKKRQFSVGCMRIQDNLGTGGFTDTIGYVKTPQEKYYRVEKGSKTAKLMKIGEAA